MEERRFLKGVRKSVQQGVWLFVMRRFSENFVLVATLTSLQTTLFGNRIKVVESCT
jgi:hypothetical protein